MIINVFTSHFFRSQDEANPSRSRSLTPSPEREFPASFKDTPILESSKEVLSEDSETLRLQKAKETAEQERLRLEVAKLENSIEPDVVMKKVQRSRRDSDSSNTDVSEDEEDEEKEVKPQPEIIDNEDDKVKKEIMEKILEKQKAEETLNNSAITKEDTKQEMNSVDENEEQKEEKVIDMFADSGDETKPTVEGDQQDTKNTDQVEKMEVEESSTTEGTAEAKKEPAEHEDKTEMQVEPPKIEEAPKVDTLKSLDELRNKMDQMTSEELEAALKNLPSSVQQSKDADDGRTTPVHLRDIEIPIKSLTEFVFDKRILWKQVFRTINKKEFKRMLPKYLRVRFL